MFNVYNPADHYWLLADGTVYSSSRMAYLQADDATYQAWLVAGGIPTAYPKDADGDESEKELAVVLGVHGLYVSLAEKRRAERNERIVQLRWRIERHNDQVALLMTPDEPLTPLLECVQALRDVPQQDGFPEIVEWPVVP